MHLIAHPLPGGVPAFEQDHELLALRLDPVLHLDELHVQLVELVLVVGALDLGGMFRGLQRRLLGRPFLFLLVLLAHGGALVWESCLSENRRVLLR